MATYYVKSAGGSGSGLNDSEAWSFAKLNSTSLISGDVILFNKGDVFYGELISRTGVTYSTYGTGANPKITGLTELTSWTLSSGNIYYATLNVPMLNMVTLNDVVKGMGRFPKTGYLPYTSHSNNTAITGATIGTLPFDATGGEVIIRKYRWVLDRHPITLHSGNTLTYTSANTYGNSGAYNPVDGNGYFIQNHLGTLTELGDWYYDITAMRFYMHFGNGTPTDKTVKVSAIDKNVQINTKNTIGFTNIDFEGGNTQGVYILGSTNITFTNCNVTKQGGNGIYGNNVTGLSVVGGSVIDILNSGVHVEILGNTTLIDGVTVTNIGAIAGAGRSGDSSYSGININGANTTIANNSVFNIGYNGINFKGSNALVELNN